MPCVIYFETRAQNPARAIEFYRGLEFNRWQGQCRIGSSRPSRRPSLELDGGLIQRKCPVDGQGVIAYVCAVNVPAVNSYVQKARFDLVSTSLALAANDRQPVFGCFRSRTPVK